MVQSHEAKPNAVMASYDTLVTGSSGHLGAALMLSLPSLGFTPLGIDILASPTTTLVGSISDSAFVASLLYPGSSIKHVIHAATLHKPHVESHTRQDFIDTNITGTLTLLEAAASLGDQLESFIYISTTSAFGASLSPAPSQPAIWISESVPATPKNIYGVTKVAAEDLCFLMHKCKRLPVVILRTSRFFNEGDDDEDRRNSMSDDNLKVLELSYRRVDMEDIVQATTLAMQQARRIGFDKFIISAPPPFTNDQATLLALDQNPAQVFKSISPGCEDLLRRLNWKFFTRIDRVYDSSKAVRELGWQPKYTFQHAVEVLKAELDEQDLEDHLDQDKKEGRREGKQLWRSELSKRIGKKGYHAMSTGIYTVREPVVGSTRLSGTE